MKRIVHLPEHLVLEYRYCLARCIMIEAYLEPYDEEFSLTWQESVGDTQKFIKTLQSLHSNTA